MAVDSVEVWLPIQGYEDLYSISSRGSVKSHDRLAQGGRGGLRLYRGRVLKQTPDAYGYPTVKLCRGPRDQRTAKVHVLVAEHFIGPRPANLDVCHNNSNSMDNRVENLRYDTRMRNHADKIAAGTSTRKDQEMCKSGKHEWVFSNLWYDTLSDSMRCMACRKASTKAANDRKKSRRVITNGS